MNYPECPDGTPDRCRLVEEGGSTTDMYSPIEYDRSGKPVGGGMNTISGTISCRKCGNRWGYAQSELDGVQRNDREFTVATSTRWRD